MGQLSFYSTLSSTAANTDYVGIFGKADSADTNLMSLSGQRGRLVSWSRRRLGEPVLSVQLTNNQIFACFEQANIQYSRIVNTHQVQMWFLNMMGENANGMYTGNLPKPTLQFVRQASKYYSRQSHPIVGGAKSRRKAWINLDSATDTYDLLKNTTDFQTGQSLSAYLGGVTAQIRKYINITQIYYHPANTVNRYWDQYSVSNQFFPSHRMMQNWRYRLRPVFQTILNAQMLQQHQFVRQANYNYNIVGDKIRISPQPSQFSRIMFDYVVFDHPVQGDRNLQVDGTNHQITSIWDAPYKNVPYNAMNSIAKRWVRQYALALCKQTLGLVRRKFSTIKIPNQSVTLDGAQLVAQGIAHQRMLRDELKVTLSKMSLQVASRADAQLSNNINVQLSFVPLGIYLG